MTSPADPFRRHIAALGTVATMTVPDGDDPDLTEALMFLDMLGIVDNDRQLLADDLTSIAIPDMGKSPSPDTAPSQRRTNWGQADDPRGLSTSPPGLRDYSATEPQRTLVGRPAPTKAAPRKRTPRGPAKKAPPAAPVRRFDQGPMPVPDIRPRVPCPVIPVVDTPAPTPAARPSTTPTPVARPAGTPEATKRRTGPRLKPIAHGTPQGYAAHYRRRELPVCRECKDAYNVTRGPQGRGRRLDYAIERARRSPRAVAPELDRWVDSASKSPSAAVRRAAAVVSGSLMVLRVAVGDLARTEARAIAPPPSKEHIG